MAKVKGFSLIEVLIALVIISLSLTAIIQSSSANVRNTDRLNEAIIAHWVGLHAVDMIQIGLLQLPQTGRPLFQKTTMLNKTWYWNARMRQTRVPGVKQIIINVKRTQSGNRISQLKAYYFDEKKEPR